MGKTSRRARIRASLGRLVARFRGDRPAGDLAPLPGFQSHPEPALEGPWHWAQLGVWLLPFSLVLGGVAWFVALVWTTRLRGDRWGQDGLNRGWGLLAIGMAITASLAVYPGEAAIGLANFLPCFWFFVGVRTLVQSPQQLRHLARIQVFSAVPVVILGLLALGGVVAGPVNLSVLVQWPLEAGGTPPGRMAGVFAYANVLASYLVVTLGLGLGLWLEAWQGRGSGPLPSPSHSKPVDKAQPIAPTPGNEPASATPGPAPAQYQADTPSSPVPQVQPRWSIALLAAAIALQALGLLLTHSRNAWGVGFLLGLVTAVRLGWFWLLWSALGAVGAVFWAAFGSVGQRLFQGIVPRFLWARLNDQLYGDRPVADLRTSQWQFAWTLTQQRPWTGWGLRNFTPLYEAATGHWLGHPHNLFLMLSAEMGLPLTLGLMGLVGWILGQGVRCWRSWPAPAAGAAWRHGQDAPELRGRSAARGQCFAPDRAMFLTYLLTFGGCVLFNCLDITLFDYRINLTNWLLLGAIAGAIDGQLAAPQKPAP